MEKFALIPVIENGVVFSDPWYGDDVYCQYRKNFHDTNWLMKMESSKEDGFISFSVTLGRPTVLYGVKPTLTAEGLSIEYPRRYQLQQVELGMDTAKIFCGLREHWDAFAEEASIKTGTDGFFGNLMVFTCEGEEFPAGFFLDAGVEEIFMDEKALFNHFLSSFNGKETSREQFAAMTDPNSLALRILASKEIRQAEKARSPESTPGKDPER